MTMHFTKTKDHYPVEDYLKKQEKYEFYCSLYRKLHSTFEDIERNERVVEAYSTSNRIAWKRSQVFAEFHVCKTKLTIHMTKPINNPKMFGENIPRKNKWYQLNWKCELTKFEDIDYIAELINQSYEQN